MPEFANVMGRKITNNNSKGFIENLLGALYPKVCPLCEEPVVLELNDTCLECGKKLVYIGENFCMKCGKEMTGDGQYCYDCSRVIHAYEQAVAVFAYSEIVKQAIYRYKYKGKREYAKWFARQAYERTADRVCIWQPDVIIPVPLHKTKMRQRGYNQAELLAQEFGRFIGIKVDTTFLLRGRATEPMKTLNGEDRIKNVEKAFNISSNNVKYKKVLLVDDIYTTGATMDACAKVLKEHGVKEIYCLSLCIGKGI